MASNAAKAITGAGDDLRNLQSGQADASVNISASAAEQGCVFGVIPKGRREQVQIAVRTFNGVRRLDIRVWHARGVPTARGVTFRPDQIRPLIEALQAAERGLA